MNTDGRDWAEERRLEALKLERSIEQRSGAGDRFARFHASMRDPGQIEFTRSMILTRPDHSEGWDLRPFAISLGILAVATILFALEESSLLTLGPTREYLGRGPPAGPLLSAAPIGPQTLPPTGDAGFSSRPVEAVSDEGETGGIVDLSQSGRSATGPAALRSYDIAALGHIETPSADGATGSTATDSSRSGLVALTSGDSIFALAEDFRRGLASSREAHGEPLGEGGSAAQRIDGQGQAASSLDGVHFGNLTEIGAIEIDSPADLGPLVRIATLRQKENIPAVLKAFDRTLGQELQFYTAKMQIDGNTFYTVYVGPFENAHAAAFVCKEMRARGGDCFLAAP